MGAVLAAVIAMPPLGAMAKVPVTETLVTETPFTVTANAETTPVTHTGDAADDPAIWVHPTDPTQSLIIGDDKKGALEVYNLDGSLQQRITSSRTFWGNVDVRQGVTIGGRTFDLVAVANGGLRLFRVDVGTRTLTQISGGTAGVLPAPGGGLCLYDSPVTGRVYAYTINNIGVVRQFEIQDNDADGVLLTTKKRTFTVVIGTPPPEATEACVVDDARGSLYVSEEEVGIWRYGAEPNAGSARSIVDRVAPNGHLVNDIEGLAVVNVGSGGYLIASAQNVSSPKNSYFVVYDRVTNAYDHSFRIVTGPDADGCERTDGVAAYAGDLGPSYPKGIFICQDNNNYAPAAGNQNFKLTRLERVVGL